MSTSEQYFRELAACLKRLPKEEREEVLRFYQEFAQESGKKKKKKLTEHFGTPRVLVSKILAESAVKTAGSPRRGGAIKPQPTALPRKRGSAVRISRRGHGAEARSAVHGQYGGPGQHRRHPVRGLRIDHDRPAARFPIKTWSAPRGAPGF